jgi:hypothetical protein
LIRFRLLLCLAALLAAASCAPLQPPTGPPAAAPAAGDSVAVAERPSALEAYRARRAGSEDRTDDAYRPWVAVLPFRNESGFRDGVWDLRHAPADLLAGEMARSTAWRVVPYLAVYEVVGKPPKRWRDEDLRQIAQALEADMLLTVDLLDYNMERLQVGDPLIGGYKSYKGLAEFEAHLIRGDDLGRVGNAHALKETVDRGLGLDLLGKPREQDEQFINLAGMDYGSDEFRGTAIGQATLTAMDALIQQLAQLVRPQGIQVTSGAAQILSVFGEEVFINIGSENGVQRGYRFNVYPGSERAEGRELDVRIAVVQVADIIGARVSRVVALSGAAEIGVGDRLELIGIEPQD